MLSLSVSTKSVSESVGLPAGERDVLAQAQSQVLREQTGPEWLGDGGTCYVAGIYDDEIW